MPHFPLITQAGDDPILKTLYAEVEQMMGEIPLPIQLFAHSPQMALTLMTGMKPFFRHPTLSAPFLTWTRYLIAKHSHCSYCVDVNAGMLLEIGVSQTQLIEAWEDLDKTSLDEREQPLLKAVIQAIQDQKALSQQQTDHLIALGWSKKELVEAMTHAGLSQMLDLVVNAFEVQ
ncbi:carboxymuconolactone decarboxylase family protein [Magnetococcus sp. PR-3]|uniref:carboxymuconolactone decarboxylase family protein n=1 Tax=Magnetococcus sp. PR-3 TaxID=3120355 RepID=UPI002FCE2F81